MSLNVNLKSNLHYNQLLIQQSNALRQLNQIDQLMYETNIMQNQQHVHSRKNRISLQNNTSQYQYMGNMHEKYPHLFDNEDSLFAPDNNLWNYPNQGNQSNTNPNACVQSDKWSSEYLSKANQASIKKQAPKQILERNKKDIHINSKIIQIQKSKISNQQLQLFQEYLQSLEINQFLEVQSIIRKNEKSKGSKLDKNLQTSLQCTFKPSILKKSSQIAGNLPPSFERLTMPVRNSNSKTPYKHVSRQIQKQYSKERIQQLSKPRALRTQPNEVIQNQRPQYKKKSTFSLKPVQRNSNYLDVAARNQLWQQQKQLKIEKLRRQEEQNRAKKQSGTFAPKILEYKGQKNVNLSNFAKQGLVNYFERLSMAKSKNMSVANNVGKQNNINPSVSLGRKESSTPYCSHTNSITNTQQNTCILSKFSKNQGNLSTNANSKINTSYNNSKKVKQRINYDQAVKQLHKKLMSLNI